jgi:hypothetical protein
MAGQSTLSGNPSGKKNEAGKGQQGKQANDQGKALESIIVPLLERKGFTPVMNSEYLKKPDKYGSELLLKNVLYTTIYNHRGYTEYKLVSKKYGKEVRIECKWQQGNGSVDEKFPYVYLNCINTMPEKDIIIIYGGSGFKEGAIEWMKNVAKELPYTTEKNRDKNIMVLNLEEFITWANNTFR